MKQINSDTPIISVIIPVYNGEKFIERCLDSLVYQTFDEFEIIVVDNASTDNTYSIVREYCKKFNNIRAYQIEHTDGPGGGRNKGLEKAKGKYIAFADADDFYTYNAMECLCQYIQTNDCDVVCFPCCEVRDQNVTLSRRLPQTDKEYILWNGSMVFWNKLIKKELYVKCGTVPEEFVFEDLAYIPIIISYAKTIGYVDVPLYYYIIRSDSSVNTLKSVRNIDSIKACKYALEHINPEYYDIFLSSVAKRISDDITNRWPFADQYIDYLLELKSVLISNKYVVEDPYFERILSILNLRDAISFNIVVNGFKNNEIELDIESLRKTAFFDSSKTNIVILNEENCDIDLNEFTKASYKADRLEELAHYFALKYIYENSGIYVGKDIEISSYLNCLRYNEMFFGYLDEQTFSDSIWGAKKNSRLCQKIIKTYEDNTYFNNIFLSLASRVRNILAIQYNQDIDGKSCITEEYSLFACNILGYDFRDNKNVCFHNFEKIECDEEYTYIKRNLLASLKPKNTDIVFKKQKNNKEIELNNMAREIIEDQGICYESYAVVEKPPKDNLIPIVMSSSDFFVPYLSVLIQSIIENSSKEFFYDLIILNKDISYYNMLRLYEMIKKLSNFKIRFYNTSEFIKKQSFQVREHFTIETYFRMFVPYILDKYDKALYLDSDMVVNADVAQLYNIDIQDKILGVTNDAIMVASYNCENSIQNNFLNNELKLQNPYNYFQAGTCIIDLKKYRKYISEGELLETICENRWLYGDQDVLNLLFEGKVFYLDMTWNYTVDVLAGRRTRLVTTYAPDDIREAFHAAKKNPKIIHYAGPQKPWNTYEAEHMQYFWKYAQNSVFYDELVSRLHKKQKYAVTDKIKKEGMLKYYVEENRRMQDKLRRYGIEIQRLLKCNRELEKQRDLLIQGIDNYENATFWKLTYPFRKIIGFIKGE